MSTVLMEDRSPNEVLSSDTHNRLQMRRAIQTRGDPTAETFVGTAGELLRVLIVDDYRASADTMAMLVDVWGHEVRRAYDGITGLALAAAYQPDVLLLDIISPTRNALELTRQMRKKTRLSDCFIIAVTGRTDARYRLQCEEAGIDLFLIKPVTPSILKTLLTWEFEYVLRSRHHKATSKVFFTTFEQLTDANLQTPAQLPCRELQRAIASYN
jgi:CheY-like chemotaxis protein